MSVLSDLIGDWKFLQLGILTAISIATFTWLIFSRQLLIIIVTTILVHVHKDDK